MRSSVVLGQWLDRPLDADMATARLADRLGYRELWVPEMAKAGASFRLVELAGDDETAWAQWEATTNKGTRQGVGVYRVRNGQLVYYKDYMNP